MKGLGSVFQCSAQVMIAVGALSRGKREPEFRPAGIHL